MADNLFEKVLEYKLMPRFMMLVMTVMYIRVLEWGMSLPDLSTQQSAMISIFGGHGGFVNHSMSMRLSRLK